MVLKSTQQPPADAERERADGQRSPRSVSGPSPRRRPRQALKLLKHFEASFFRYFPKAIRVVDHGEQQKEARTSTSWGSQEVMS